MCRNIRTLYNFEPPTTDEEIQAAAVQFVRKVSGMQKPSQANQEPFDRAVAEVAAATSRLLDSLVTTATPPRECASAAGPRSTPDRSRTSAAAGRRAGSRSAAARAGSAWSGC